MSACYVECIVSTFALVDILIPSFNSYLRLNTWGWRKNINLSKTRENMVGWKQSQKQIYGASYCEKNILSLLPGCFCWFRVGLEAGYKSQKEGILNLVLHYQKCNLCLKSCVPHIAQPVYGGNSKKQSQKKSSPIFGFFSIK